MQGIRNVGNRNVMVVGDEEIRDKMNKGSGDHGCKGSWNHGCRVSGDQGCR